MPTGIWKRSKEQKEKAIKNIVSFQFKKGHVVNGGFKKGNLVNLGKKRKPLSDSTKLKISNKLIGIYKGNKSSNWKGGISSENKIIRASVEYRLWRESVFSRDNWTCQKTKVKGGFLHPHHIKNFSQYPELRFAIDNGITFSKKAHDEFHKKYGRKNNTLEQVIEFLDNKNIEASSFRCG